MAFDLKNLFSSLKSIEARPTKMVGIDFGASSVKVVEIEFRDEVLTLSTYGELQTGPYAQVGMGSVTKLPVSKSVEALVDIMREAGIEAKHGVLALPLADSFVTVMSLSAKKNEDISTRVPVEARKYIPVPLTEVALEWTELPTSKDESLAREILLAAIQNEALADMRSLMGTVEMASESMEIELFSTLRALTRETDSTIAVIDMGAHMSKLYISENGFLRRIHRVRAGGADATELISKRLDLSFEDAENLKRNYTPDHPAASQVVQAVQSVCERPFQEFKRVIDQYESHIGAQVGRVVITGGSSLFYDMSTFASYMLDHQVELATPFSKVAYPAFMEDALAQIGPIFAPAIGAALRAFE